MNINWRSQAGRSWLYQILAIALVVLVAGWLINNTLVNMKARGIQSGFDFLLQSAGFAKVEYYNLAAGVVALHKGWKI